MMSLPPAPIPAPPPLCALPRRLAALVALGLGCAMTLPFPARAEEATPMTAQQSDPAMLGWMVGAPPPADKIIRFSDGDYFTFPKLRWTVCHFRQLMPTIGVGRGLGPLRFFERKIDDSIEGLSFMPLGGAKPMTFGEAFDVNYTDGLVVLHKGVLVYERYAGCLDETGQFGFAHPQSDPVARHPRLRDLQFGAADPVPVADAHLVVRQPVDGQVLAELPVHEVVPPEMLLPVTVRIDLVDHHGPLLAAVAGLVALPVAVQVQPPDHHRPVDRLLPDSGEDGLAVPFDVLRHSDVDRQNIGCAHPDSSSTVRSRSTPCEITP